MQTWMHWPQRLFIDDEGPSQSVSRARRIIAPLTQKEPEIARRPAGSGVARTVLEFPFCQAFLIQAPQHRRVGLKSSQSEN